MLSIMEADVTLNLVNVAFLSAIGVILGPHNILHYIKQPHIKQPLGRFSIDSLVRL